MLTNKKTRQQDLNFFAKQGIEPRKIILWNNQGVPEFFNAQDNNGVPVVFMEGLQFHIRKPEDENFVGSMQWQLSRQKQFYATPPEYFPMILAQSYQQMHGKPLDWNNLQTWTEKMQWIKLYDNTPIKTRLADKFLVRQWIAEKIGDEYLIPLLGVWDNFDEIDFDALPNQFVLKCNHGSGMNIIVRDKKDFDIESAREKINAWLAIDYGTLFFEPLYNNIPKKIIAEKLMIDENLPDILDYKFLCFGGKIFYVYCVTERSTNYRLDYFDMNWKPVYFERQDNHPCSDNPEKVPKPKNFELMKKLAAELCKDFIHVRVDFYEIEDKIYFGEMTFIPDGGNIGFRSKGTNELLGNLINLPVK